MPFVATFVRRQLTGWPKSILCSGGLERPSIMEPRNPGRPLNWRLLSHRCRQPLPATAPLSRCCRRGWCSTSALPCCRCWDRGVGTALLLTPEAGSGAGTALTWPWDLAAEERLSMMSVAVIIWTYPAIKH